MDEDRETEALWRLNEYEQFQLKDKLQTVENFEGRREIIRDYLKIVGNDKEIPVLSFDDDFEWFNVETPLHQNHLLGRITVVDFFTYCCVNCMHILPDLEAVEERFPDRVLVVGVHSAKFDNEKVSDNIFRAIQRYGIRHPVANDHRVILWKKFVISCWPTLLVLGPDARPIMHFVGEGHREAIFEFLKVALEYYDIKNPVELPKIQLGLRTAPPVTSVKPSSSFVKYPGKAISDGRHVFVSDTCNHRIVTSSGLRIGFEKRGFDDGPFSVAKFNSPQGLCIFNRSLYVCDTNNHAIRMCDLDSLKVTTVVGNGKQGKDRIGGKLGKEQEIASPWDVCVGRSPGSEVDDVLYIAMAGSHQIWAYALEDDVKFWKGVPELKKGHCAAVAGSGAEENRNTSYPLKAGFAQPSGISFDSDNKIVYIADSESSSVRKLLIKENGAVKNVVGAARDPTDLFKFGDVDGSGIEAKLQHPLGVAVYGSSLIVADSYNHRIKIVSDLDKKTQSIKTLISKITFNEPGGVFVRGSDIIIADTNNQRILKGKLCGDGLEMETISFDEVTVDVTDSTLGADVIRVNSKTFSLTLSLSTGKALNSEAPNTWTLHLPDTLTANATKGAVEDEILRFNLSSNSEEPTRTTLRLDLKLFICDKEKGTCSIVNKSLPILIAPEAKDNGVQVKL